MLSVFSFDGKIFYFNSIRIKTNDYANCDRLTVKKADIKGSRIKVPVNHRFRFITNKK